jgi:hypothetical protein
MLIGILVIQAALLAVIAIILWRGVPKPAAPHAFSEAQHQLEAASAEAIERLRAYEPIATPPVTHNHLGPGLVQILKNGRHHGWRSADSADIEEALQPGNDLSVRWPDGTVQETR